MKTRGLVLILSLVVLLSLLAAGCSTNSAQITGPVQPPVEFVKARTMDGSGLVVLVMRTWDKALNDAEIEQIKNDLAKELPEVWQNDNAVAVPEAKSVSSGESRCIALVYAVYKDKIPHPYVWLSGNDQGLEVFYDRALKIFTRELAGLDNWGYIE